MMKVTATVVFALSFFQMTMALDTQCLEENLQEVLGYVRSCSNDNNVKVDYLLQILKPKCDTRYKCTLACMMESVQLMQNDQVAIDVINNLIELIPIARLKKDIKDMVNYCDAKGKGGNKCENAHGFVLCMKKKGIALAMKLFIG